MTEVSVGYAALGFVFGVLVASGVWVWVLRHEGNERYMAIQIGKLRSQVARADTLIFSARAFAARVVGAQSTDVALRDRAERFLSLLREYPLRRSLWQRWRGNG